MSLWNNKQEDLITEIARKEKLVTSGVYAVEIKEAYLTNSNQSKARAVTLSFESENNYGRVSFWFLKADGTENSFATKALNRMMYLCKFKPGHDLKQETKKIKLFDGKEIDRIFLPELNGKNIGMIIEAKKDGDNINLEVKDFFDIKSRKTSDEILNKTESTTVPFYEEKYKDAKPQGTEKSNNGLPYETDKNITTVTSSDFNDDEFPF